MNRFAVIITSLACWSAAAATLPQVPTTASRLANLDRNLFRCGTVENQAECRSQGRPAGRIAEEPVVAIVLFYRGETLVRSVFAFKEDQFDELVGRLTQQLGTPESGSEGLKAGMGGVFENRYYVWKLNGQIWFVEQFFERISTSGLWIMDAAEFEVLQAERESMRFRGARDL